MNPKAIGSKPVMRVTRITIDLNLISEPLASSIAPEANNDYIMLLTRLKGSWP